MLRSRLPLQQNLAALLIPLGFGAALSLSWMLARAAGTAIDPPITWTDLAGRRYGPSDISGGKATVFIFFSTECPVANRYTGRMSALANRFMPRDVRFFLVDASRNDSADALRRYAQHRGIPFPAVKDDSLELADRLSACTTPEAVILDSRGAIRYRGRIDDNADPALVIRHDLRDALENLLSGKLLLRPSGPAFGCAIFRDPVLTQARNMQHAARVTYARDVAPILNRSCLSCHRAGEVAPFSLESYQSARPWARQIKEYTSRRIMPPWKVVPGVGEFHGAPALTDVEIQTLAEWADTGAILGDPRQAPAPPRFPPPGSWTLGKPDMILQPDRPFHVEAEGEDIYRNFVLPQVFREERFVAAIEFKPDNRRAVHHMVAFVDPTGACLKKDGHESEPGYSAKAGDIFTLFPLWGDVWIPGSAARRFPPGAAIRIPPGARIVLQIHYHKTGQREVDRSRLGLILAKGQVDKISRVWPVGQTHFRIQPGASGHEIRGSITVPDDIHVWSVFPHMHVLGQEMKVTATLPDGQVIPMIWVRDWDFNWQATYFYKQPVALPKGSKIEVVGKFDNSDRNPRQPFHPPKLVSFGVQTTDEMCFAFLTVTLDNEHIQIRRASVRR